MYEPDSVGLRYKYTEIRADLIITNLASGTLY